MGNEDENNGKVFSSILFSCNIGGILGIDTKKIKRGSGRDMYVCSHAHFNIIGNSQDMETI